MQCDQANVRTGLFLAPGMVSEARKGSLLLQKVLGMCGAQVPDAECSQVDSPFLSLDAGSEALLWALLDAIDGSICFRHESHSLETGATAVHHAGGGFVQGSTADIGAYGVMQDPFPCVLYGGTHWSQWVPVLAQLSRGQQFQPQ